MTQAQIALKRKIVADLMLLREKYGLTQREIAALVGVTESTISRQHDDGIGPSDQMQKSLEMLKQIEERKRQERLTELADKLTGGTITVSEKAELLRIMKA